MLNNDAENMVQAAMKRLDSLMEEGVANYQSARKMLVEKAGENTKTLADFDREWLIILERLGVSIADMYRLIKEKNPA